MFTSCSSPPSSWHGCLRHVLHSSMTVAVVYDFGDWLGNFQLHMPQRPSPPPPLTRRPPSAAHRLCSRNEDLSAVQVAHRCARQPAPREEVDERREDEGRESPFTS